jgi:fructokinase
MKEFDMADERRFAGIEAGGTKFVCALATADGRILARERIATADPALTLSQTLEFFGRAGREHGAPAGAGIASFGPLDLDPASPAYGRIVSTPKPGWSDVNILAAVRDGLGVPTRIDTDVNAAALAEGRHGAAKGCHTHAYVTVGTGIGVGLVAGGRSLIARGHAEMGHIPVPRAPGDDFAGVCSYHGDCLEGMASGPAMAARWGCPAQDLGADHPAWAMQAHYVAALCCTLIYTVRPDRIVIGGGVFEQPGLHAHVRRVLEPMLAGYGLAPHERDLDTLIVAPGLVETPPGLLGALELARQAADG